MKNIVVYNKLGYTVIHISIHIYIYTYIHIYIHLILEKRSLEERHRREWCKFPHNALNVRQQRKELLALDLVDEVLHKHKSLTRFLNYLLSYQVKTTNSSRKKMDA